jgi:hypothetical protein
MLPQQYSQGLTKQHKKTHMLQEEYHTDSHGAKKTTHKKKVGEEKIKSDAVKQMYFNE